MTERQTPFSDQVFHHLLSMIRHSRQYRRQIMDNSDLTSREFSVLLYLLETGSATVGQVQAFVHKSLSTTSALISQLKEKGFTSRRRSQEDNRVVIVALTSHGQKIAKNTPLGGLPLLRRLLNQLSKKHLIEIDDVLIELTQMIIAAGSE